MRRIISIVGDMLEYKLFRQKIFDMIAICLIIVFVVVVFGLMVDIQAFMRAWGLML